MGIMPDLFRRRGLRFPLSLLIFLFLLFFSVSAFGGNEEKENGITCYLVSYMNKDFYSRLSFNIEYERRISDRFSLAASMGYAPMIRPDMESLAWYKFHNKVGDNFTQISYGGFVLILDFGLYVYFPRSNKRDELFLYLGTSYYRVRDHHKMFDNKSSITESFSLSFSEYSRLDMGLGYKHKFNERYFLRAEWRMGDFYYFFRGGEPLMHRILLGLSYRF
jgi:hypothetical protein